MSAQIAAFFFGVVACGLCATSTFWNQWAYSGPASHSFTDPVWTWESLWETCIEYTGEHYSCERKVSIFDIQGKYHLSVKV